MKRFAILLGSEEYDEASPTAYCHNDVKLLKNTLINCSDFAEQDIISKLLTPEDEITPKSILDEIENLVEKSQYGDTILFYYAGHGHYYNGDSYIILPRTQLDNIENTAIALRDISTLLRNKGKINVRIFDACRSGQDVRSLLNYKEFSRDILNNLEAGWITLASCREDGYSYPDENFEQGVFTYYLSESIKEFNENEEIYPELLKLKVCKKVANWSEDNNLIQVPTFNSSISGNIVIAKRKINKDNRDTGETEIVEKEKVDIEEKLEKVRKFDRIGNEEHIEKLEDYISRVYSIMESKLSNIKSFGSTPEIHSPIKADNIPSNIKSLIFKTINTKKLKTLHKFEVEREYEEPSIAEKRIAKIDPFYKPEKKLIAIHHKISQDYYYPNSYLDVKLKSDGYVPFAQVFIYIVPLLISSCMISGFYLEYEDSDTTRDYKEYTLDPIFMNFEEEINIEQAKNNIDDLINLFNKKYKKFIRNRLEYLEWEIEQI